MPALGQKQTFSDISAMSALPPKADIVQDGRDVRFVPKADILHCGKDVAIRSPRQRGQPSVGSMLPGYRNLSCEAEYWHAKLSTGHFRNGARMITLGEYSIS
jgi:hypothetical protein